MESEDTEEVSLTENLTCKMEHEDLDFAEDIMVEHEDPATAHLEHDGRMEELQAFLTLPETSSDAQQKKKLFSKTPIIRLHDLKHLLDIRPGRRFRVRPAKSTRRGRPPLRGRGLSRQARREEKKSCCVPGCGTSDAAEQDKNCFSFPPKPFYPEQNQMWCQAVGLSMNSPYHTLRVCEDHFYLGRPSAVRGHPDYVPSIQMPGENKVQRPVSTQDWAAFHRRLKVLTEQAQRPSKPKEDVEVVGDENKVSTKGSTDGTAMKKTESAQKEASDRSISTAPTSSNSSIWQMKYAVSSDLPVALRLDLFAKNLKTAISEIALLQARIKTLTNKLESKSTYVTNLQKLLAEAHAKNKELQLSKKVAEAKEVKKIYRETRGTQIRHSDLYHSGEPEFSDDEVTMREKTRRRQKRSSAKVEILSIDNGQEVRSEISIAPKLSKRKRMKGKEGERGRRGSIEKAQLVPAANFLKPVEMTQVPEHIRKKIEAAIANKQQKQQQPGQEHGEADQSNVVSDGTLTSDQLLPVSKKDLQEAHPGQCQGSVDSGYPAYSSKLWQPQHEPQQQQPAQQQNNVAPKSFESSTQSDPRSLETPPPSDSTEIDPMINCHQYDIV